MIELVEYSKKKGLHELFEEAVEANREKTAIKYETEELTYDELNKKTNQLAHYLRSIGVQKNDHIGIIVNRSINMAAAVIAVLKCGGVYVPIDPGYPEERITYILENTEARLIITDDASLRADTDSVVLTEVPYDRMPDTNLKIKREPEDLAYIIYTSGSSGKPKGVMLEHHSVVNTIEWVNKTFHISNKDTALCVTSVCFDLSVYDIFGILAAGGKLVIAPTNVIKNANLLKEYLIKEEITFWNSVPSTMTSLMNSVPEGKKDLFPKLKNVLLSGDWIPIKTVKKIKACCPNVLVTSLGGATEAAIWSIYYPIHEINPDWVSIPYGKPIQNQIFYILDEAQNMVKKGDVGELYIGGVGVARGYMNDMLTTKKAFVHDKFSKETSAKMYRTGDLGRFMEDGMIEFLGRADDQVKIRGFRIELKEVEKNLMEYKGITGVVAVARKNEQNENYLCAYLICEESVSITALKQFLMSRLPGYMVPSVFIRMKEFPLNGNGKIDKKALPKPEIHQILMDVPYKAAETRLETEILKAWEKVLGLTGIGTKNSFFDLGGTSLNCITLETELNEKGIPLSYQELMEFDTVSSQAAFFERKKEKTVEMITEWRNSTNESLLKPFNDLYYKNCMYNSLFPVLSVYGIPIEAVMCNDIFAYDYLEDKKVLSSVTVEEYPIHRLLEQIGVKAVFLQNLSTEQLKRELDSVLEKKCYAIVFVDSYYEPKRRDTYQKEHFAHTLLVYGRNEDGYVVFEHSHKDALNYKEQIIEEQVLKDAYMGYRKYLCKEEGTYALIELLGYSKKQDFSIQICKEKLVSQYRKNRMILLQGIRSLEKFLSEYGNSKEELLLQIVEENKILDIKRSEYYRAEKVSMHQAAQQYSKIIVYWEKIRNDTIRISKGLLNLQEKREEHKEVLRKIIFLEKEILENMVDEKKINKIHYLAQKYNEYNLPLYLSYPIESHWHSPSKDLAERIQAEQINEADLYVHIPFCKEMCYFCCCDKMVTHSEEKKENYLQMLERELRLKFHNHSLIKISNMHWGGGTPTYLSISQIERLFSTLKQYFVFDKNAKLNIEAYPETDIITREKLLCLKQLGFTSISFGVQDFDLRVQHTLNRRCNEEETLNLVQMSKEIGLDVHIDLCYGLPYQGLNEFENTLEVVKKAAPTQIVIYPYAHYPFLFPLQRKIPELSLPNAFMKILLIDLADTLLGVHYDKYGIDTYIRKNAEGDWKNSTIIRNFMGTNMESEKTLLGIGMAAISKYDFGYVKNNIKLDKYQESLLVDRLPFEKMCIMSEDDKIRNTVIQNHILSNQCINKKEINGKYGLSFDDYFKKEISVLQCMKKDELLKSVSSDEIELTDYGKFFTRCIAHVFNKYYK